MTTSTLLANGSHQRTTATAERAYVPPAPSIEATGNGWYRVVGGQHGPVDRFGRANAESTLAAIVASREDADHDAEAVECRCDESPSVDRQTGAVDVCPVHPAPALPAGDLMANAKLAILGRR